MKKKLRKFLVRLVPLGPLCGVTLDELETLKQRLFHLRINEDGPVAMKLRLLDSSGFEDID